MCFSATASFSAGAVLLTAGTLTVTKANWRTQFAFAAIPFLFGIQQIAEGFVWLALQQNSLPSQPTAAVYVFLFFSHLLWPVWVPFSVLQMENPGKRKNSMFFIFIVALLFSGSEWYCLLHYSVNATFSEHHIEYNIHFPAIYIACTNVIYGIVTLVPCLITRTKKVWVFSAVLAGSIVVTQFFYAKYLISVWCFFAALLSMVIYWIVGKTNATEQY